MKKQFGEYFLGFDIGTDSIGWAVTNEDYKILKVNGKSMWGIHLFDSGKTAEERRAFRCARRRTARVSQRLSLLKDLFEEEILKKDGGFFQRLSDSKFYKEDKKENQKNALFNDENFTDKEYYEKYPTIYHLRSTLVHNHSNFDIRLVYLAIHNIIKHRGHFLYEGQDFSSVTSFKNVFEDSLNVLNDYGIEFDFTNANEIEEVLKNNQLKISQKQKELSKLMNSDTKQKKSITNLLSGGKVALSDIFEDENLKHIEIPKISFLDINEEISAKLTDILEEKMFIINKLKSIYDWSVLVNILKNQEFLSDAKVEIYEEHKKDLRTLKELVRKYLSDKDYKEIFKSEKIVCNYCAYIGKDSEKETVKICSKKDFCTYIVKKFKNVIFKTNEENEFFDRLSEGQALPKQISNENGVIPYQLHLYELKTILNNAKEYLPFLLERDKDGITVYEKIISILTFRIPYYVGPLNSYSKNAWLEKKTNQKIYPWNFDEVVDKLASADKFILRMTNKCTYLPTEDVVAKNSIIYSKYNILNQLNNLRVNGEKISVSLKQDIFNDLFMYCKKPVKVTKNRLQTYIKSKGIYQGEIDITGMDIEIVGNLKVLVDFKKICGEKLPSDDVIDGILTKIVILGESKELLKEYLIKNYSDILSQEQIIGLCKLNYTGWARFSRKFLTEIYHTDSYTGECKNIITMLYETNENLMELLSYKYTFLKEIENYNNKNSNNDVFDKSILDDLYVSPAIKRSIWRVMMLSKEIVKITGLQPKKIFIEMARDVNDGSKKGKRTQSRKNQLLEYYQKAKIEEKELLSQLENADEGDLRDNRIYLYYAQMGRCMYSGEKIDFSQINSFYDIDHIYPQSKVKDDSITANKVLVKKTLNSSKGDMYPIPEKCLSKEAYNLWKVLLDKGLITKEKYSRLIRKNEFSDDELSGFIARQLVETRQSTKAVAEILKKSYPESKMVYVKAGNVSLFREDYGIKKSRIVNDYHHAKDAYLNIVVGNVYDEKFTSNPINFIKKKNTYSMNRVFEFPVIKGDKVVWESKDAQSLIKVKNQVEKNDILFTRYATTNNSGFFNQMPVKAQKIINSKGSLFLPLKQNDDRLADMTKYGGYDSIKGAYFFLVEHIQKGKKVRTIEFVPVYLAKKIEQSIDELQKYIDENLKLVDAKILLPKIKINTLFKINGAYMHLSGRTGLQLTFKGAMPLVISKYLYEYTKKIESYINRNKEQKTILPIGPLQKITAEDNLKLYDELLHKLKDTIYNIRLSSQIKTFENGREKFISLNLQQQCQLLYNAMILFGTTPALADLTLIGGSKNAGVLVASSNISNSNQISIINQSVTGIFKEEIDLKSDELANCRNK